MKHADQPAAVYDLTVLASTVARHNVRKFDVQTKEQAEEAHEEALHLMDESRHKPPIAHTDSEAVRLAHQFADWVLQMIISAEQGEKMDSDRALRSREAVERFQCDIQKLNGEKKRWLIEQDVLQAMYGLDIASQEAVRVMHEENEAWKIFEPNGAPNALQGAVSDGEVKRLSEIARTDIFGIDPFEPAVYIDPEHRKHYLFWTSTSEEQECAVPSEYSLAQYLCFHFPHNELHLAHLHALAGEGVWAYVDQMDERAFFEAVAVHSEWALFDHLRNGNGSETAKAIHEQLDPARRKNMDADELQSWMIANRGYECRLRAARLVADVLTIRENLPFTETVEKGVGLTGLSRTDMEAETRKYYFLTGLGAVYSLGYKQLIGAGILNSKNAYEPNGNGMAIRTWFEFSSRQNEQ